MKPLPCRPGKNCESVGGRLVTFDSGIALPAVRGASARHLVNLV